MKKLLLTLALLLTTVLPVAAQNHTQLLDELKASRANYPAAMSRAQAAEWLNNFAFAHPGWGLLRKGSGNSCPLHDTFISCDILIDKAAVIHYDVASGADFDGSPNMNPVFNSDGPCVISDSSGCQMSNFLTPFAPTGYTPPDPIEPAKPTATVTAIPPAVLEFMAAVAGALDSEQGKLDGILAKLDAVLGQIAALKAHVDELPATQTVPPLGKIVFPVYKANIFGQSVTLTPQVVK